jgi:putative thiamine transport system permease protein
VTLFLRALVAVYALVLVLIAAMSIIGVWTFPALLPQVWSAAAWQTVALASDTVAFTAALALASSVAALLLVVGWLEATPPAWDRQATPLLMLPLVLPGLLLMVGLYQVALRLGLDGTRLGLWWVHSLLVLPYVFVALAPAWRNFDRRYEWTALALGRSRWAFWWHVKWPLLRAPLAAAAAVGFAVSVAQYLPTQFIGAGRHATVTTEAVTLASGGQRGLAAAFALLQALLPALGFGLARVLAPQRWRHPG